MKTNRKWNFLASRLLGSCLALVLAIVLTGCDSLSERLSQSPTALPPAVSPTPSVDNGLSATSGSLFEVNTPAAISRLAPTLAKDRPQVEILSPKFDEVVTDDSVTVKLKVANLPLFKSALGLGNHLHAILDKQPYQGVYDLNQPLILKNLAPGTHTLRVFASRPWHESFKNEGAYDRVTFHVLTKTAENNPDPQKPLLTYSRPSGTYGAEPIMLDYYLTNAPTHPAPDNSGEAIPDWRIRVTINDQRFMLDRWAPVYLQGFKRGKNLVKMELVDDRGNPIPNVYNENISSFTYDPQQQDSLAKLVTGELDPTLALALVDPSHIANKSTPAPTVATVPIAPAPPSSIASGSAAPAGVAGNKIEDRAAAKPVPQPTGSPILNVPVLPVPQPTQQPPLPQPTPSPIAIVPTPQPEVATNPEPVRTQGEPITIVEPQPHSAPVVQPSTLPIPHPSVVPTQQPIAVVLQPPTTVTPIAKPPAAPLAQPAPIAIVPALPPTPQVSIAPILPALPLQPSIPVQQPLTPPTPKVSIAIAPILQPEVSPNPVGTNIIDRPLAPPAPAAIAASPQPQISLAPPAPSTIAPTIQPTPAPIVPVRPPTTQVAVEPIPPSPPLQPSAPQATTPEAQTWQTKAIELFNAGRAKIRQYTNTIPAKARRFARNLKTWTGYAIDKIQEFRAERDRGNAA